MSMYHQAIRVLNEFCDHPPVRRRIEHDAHPAPVSHVRGPEVAPRMELHESLLRSERSRQPHREVWRAVVVIVEHRKRVALLPRKPGRLAVRDSLDSTGEGHADGPQPREGIVAASRARRASRLRLGSDLPSGHLFQQIIAPNLSPGYRGLASLCPHRLGATSEREPAGPVECVLHDTVVNSALAESEGVQTRHHESQNRCCSKGRGCSDGE